MRLKVVESKIGPEPGTVHAAEAAQWAASIDGENRSGVFGSSGDVALNDATYFDVASVSKLFTATAAAIAIDRGLLALHDCVESRFPTAKNGTATLAQVLNHSSGYPAWDKYYERLPFPNSKEEALENRARILDEILAVAPRIAPGILAEYSDLGYMLLGHWVERAFDLRLDEVVDAEITTPLGMTRSRYVYCEPPIVPTVRTELDDRRPHVTDRVGAVCGVVHDENCYIQGGVAGHAGLFSTASDLVRFGVHMLDVSHGEDGIVSRETLKTFWSRKHLGPSGHHVLGWDTPSGEKTSVGRGFSSTSVGHLGFTGTSLWIDPETNVVASLLTNRVYPTRDNDLILDLRIAFHEAVQPP